MVTGFEVYTSELSDEEYALAERVASLLRTAKKERPLTNNELRRRLFLSETDRDSARMRKIIHYLRVSGKVPGLLSSSRGYWVSLKPADLEQYEESLAQREHAILAVRLAIRSQRLAVLAEVQGQGELF